jgi:hypothetical protein
LVVLKTSPSDATAALFSARSTSSLRLAVRLYGTRRVVPAVPQRSIDTQVDEPRQDDI